MAQSGYTPILIYGSGTAASVPLAANMTSSSAGAELALNYADGKLYFKNSSGVVTLLAQSASASPVTTFSAGTTGFTPSTATSGAITLAGTLATTNGGTGLTSFTSGGAVYASSTSALTTGTLPTTAGGTGLASFTAGDLPYYATGTALSKLGIGTNGQILTSSGTAPQWSTLSGVAVTTFSGGTTGLTPSSATAGAITLAGTLVVSNGGTGATTLTGVLKGNGTSAFTAATAGTDYVAPGTATTFTATQTFSGSSSVEAMKTSNIAEVDTISATAATGTINFDITTQSVLYYTTNASANWTVNFRGSSGTSLNTIMSTGECISATFLVTQGSTAYYNSAVTIDGTSVTPKWQGGSAPTSGNASSVDCYTYVIQKTGSATFAVLASQTKFA